MIIFYKTQLSCDIISYTLFYKVDLFPPKINLSVFALIKGGIGILKREC